MVSSRNTLRSVEPTSPSSERQARDQSEPLPSQSARPLRRCQPPAMDSSRRYELFGHPLSPSQSIGVSGPSEGCGQVQRAHREYLGPLCLVLVRHGSCLAVCLVHRSRAPEDGDPGGLYCLIENADCSNVTLCHLRGARRIGSQNPGYISMCWALEDLCL